MKIGIFWFYKNEVMGFAHAFDSSQADSLGMIDSSYTHVAYWQTLQGKLPQLKHIEYEDIPRGRAIFDMKKNKLIIYLDEKLLVKHKVLKICHFFDSEYQINTILCLDPHYKTYAS